MRGPVDGEPLPRRMSPNGTKNREVDSAFSRLLHALKTAHTRRQMYRNGQRIPLMVGLPRCVMPFGIIRRIRRLPRLRVPAARNGELSKESPLFALGFQTSASRR